MTETTSTSPEEDLRLFLRDFESAAQQKDRGRLREILQTHFLLPDRARQYDIPLLLRYADHVSGHSTVGDEDLACCLSALQQCALPEMDFAAVAMKLLGKLGFDALADLPRAHLLFKSLAVPLLGRAVALGYHDAAILLEAYYYQAYCRAVDNREHFTQFWDALRPLMLKVGEACRAALPPRRQAGRPHVAFLMQRASGLAHEEVLRNMLTGWSQMKDKPFDATVVYLVGGAEKSEEKMAETGCAIGRLELDIKTFASVGIPRLRSYLAEIGASIVVQVSVSTLLYPVFAARVAPVQVFWAMKYHDVEAYCIDGYITGSSLAKFRDVDGRRWRACLGGYVGLNVPQAAAPAAEVARKIRNSFGGDDVIIIGSLGREQKLNSRPFLECVARVMQRHPKTVFLWTGRTQPPSISQVFVDHGVASRTLHIGWVDTRLWGHVLDIFADSFPLGSGLTLYQSMAVGKTAVFFDSPEAREMGLNQVILDALADPSEEGSAMRAIYAPDGENLFLCAPTAAVYETNLERVVTDASLRRRIGAANQAFVSSYLENTQRMASVFAMHIDEIVAERQAAPAGSA